MNYCGLVNPRFARPSYDTDEILIWKFLASRLMVGIKRQSASLVVVWLSSREYLLGYLLGRQVRQGWPKLRQRRGRRSSVACRLQQMQFIKPPLAFLWPPPTLRKKRLSKVAVYDICTS